MSTIIFEPKASGELIVQPARFIQVSSSPHILAVVYSIIPTSPTANYQRSKSFIVDNSSNTSSMAFIVESHCSFAVKITGLPNDATYTIPAYGQMLGAITAQTALILTATDTRADETLTSPSVLSLST